MASPDGVAWTDQTTPSICRWTSVTFGADNYVAVADYNTNYTCGTQLVMTSDAILSSTDGSELHDEHRPARCREGDRSDASCAEGSRRPRLLQPVLQGVEVEDHRDEVGWVRQGLPNLQVGFIADSHLRQAVEAERHLVRARHDGLRGSQVAKEARILISQRSGLGLLVLCESSCRRRTPCDPNSLGFPVGLDVQTPLLAVGA